MRGVTGIAGYVPHWRLDRAAVSDLFGTGGGRGSRAVAAHDEDTTTMGVEAARLARRGAPAPAPNTLWFATATPAYLDKTNAATVHAALRLPSSTGAFDFGGALRSGTGALSAALTGSGGDEVLVVAADRRDGLPTSSDESSGGDGAAAVLVGDATTDRPVIAEYLGGASATDEFLDRWRAPGDRRSRTWEERFGETRYVPLAAEAWEAGLKAAGVAAGEVDRAAVAGMHGRAVRSAGGRLGLREGALADDLTAVVGQCGTAHPLLLLASMLEEAGPGELVALLSLADGADALLFRTTPSIATWSSASPVARQAAEGVELPYGKFLAWREMVTPEPPRRPEPGRVSSSAAWRSEAWKYGFVGSRDRSSAAVHLPPARVSMAGGAVDDMDPVERADTQATIATFTVDRLAYSPSPPVVFAVVDFDGGGRFPVELTDVDAESVSIGDRVTMTFRRLYSADGIHDYFWKAKPTPGGRRSASVGS
ncbi:MAG TPA: OB-fold domain-containing protein [Acidimicrobiales bacterium]|nr:OB-fold domain-containing protein [Acidimicrobiales bacterium]